MSYLKWGSIACTLMFVVIPSSLFAVDGTVLIDQNHALAGNVTAGDAPGFPVTISQPGSYKLSGNLAVPDINTTAIQITSPNVTLDLNGFSIIGPVVCTSSPAQCPTPGKGVGILSVGDNNLPGPHNVRVMNGSIHGMGLLAIEMTGEVAFVDRVSVDNNAGGGMTVAGTVLDSAAVANGKWGIFAITVRECTAVDNTADGIMLDGSGGVGIGNVASFNGGHGMNVPNGSVTGNTIVRNASFGITAVCPSSIVGNTIVSNTLGSITQTNLDVCVLVNNANRP